ncbi:short-chain dehydrogenase/reductase SDR [Talaromyces proteolyticus]|uniref:Short-chain dehydrogenase/reductase SDR n=1 Tax=Talaromyces proteolyticus TaxID=1131652 RepID=A0AAD4L0F2_9EURO|nr:short-chain dehydrogenase/reductase SDR [Talaromyces proteolyticus]KAH8703441.1 short-chain dehydrogenase/reductase SDR [Talaromyces proteolyticus]
MKTWLVTGASSGLGAAIAEAALQTGHKVIATARNPTKAAQANPRISELGGTWIELDVTSPNTPKIVEDAVKEAGGVIDVVVNNAGYSLLGSIEDMSESEIEAQFSTNVYGPVRVLKGVLPFMRARKSGTVVNISSSAGIDGLPTCAMYAGSKFALEGMSESLARELAPFGIRVLVVEPGSLRTNFWSVYVEPAAGMNKDYAGTPLEQVLQLFKSNTGAQPGDAVKCAQRILEVVEGTGMGVGKENLLRLPLGPDCYKRFQTKIDTLQENLLQAKEIAHSTTY